MRFSKKFRNMRRKKILVYPHLCNRKGDLSKKWYVELSMRSPDTDEMVRSRYECYGNQSINDFKIKAERVEIAQKIITDLKQKIDTGWTIFNDIDDCVYEDQIQYSNVAQVYNEKVKSNKNYNYWVSKYITEVYPELRIQTSTQQTYTSRYRRFGIWLKFKKLDHLNLREISNRNIIDFFLFLSGDKNLSKRTYRSYIDLLSAFFHYTKQQKGIAENPVFDIPKNRIEKNMAPVRIHSEDVQKLMLVLDVHDPQLALACRFEYYCGLRPGKEIRLMHIYDLDLRAGVGKVRISYETAKTNRTRNVVIPDVFLNYILSTWKLNDYPGNYYVFGKNGAPAPECIGKNSLRFRFNKFREQLKLPAENKLYSMKHTGAVTLAEQGEALINIRDHLGHTSVSTTEHYLRRHGFNESKIIRHNFPKI
jgi:integrase